MERRELNVPSTEVLELVLEGDALSDRDTVLGDLQVGEAERGGKRRQQVAQVDLDVPSQKLLSTPLARPDDRLPRSLPHTKLGELPNNDHMSKRSRNQTVEALFDIYLPGASARGEGHPSARTTTSYPPPLDPSLVESQSKPYLGTTERLLDNHVATLGSESDRDSLGENVDTGEESLATRVAELELLRAAIAVARRS